MRFKPKLIRITTIPLSLELLLKGQLEFMQDYFEVVAVSADKEALERLGKERGYPTYHVEMTRQITPVADIKAVYKLYKYFKKEKPTIVHTHTPKAGIVGMMAAWLAGVPHRLHTVAGLPLMEATGMKRKVLDFVEKLTYSSATKVYPNSKKLKEFILEHQYAPSEKLKVIANGSSNGIDTAYFDPDQVSSAQKQQLKEELEIKADDFVFVFVGRLVGDKGINELVSAFKSVQQEGLQKQPKLLLVGDFETELDALQEDTLQEIKQNSAILSVGFQKDVRPYFAIADCLAFPSYREGFPNVLMQAGAMGLPSIVSNINGCNEIIVSGENGLIVPVKNSHDLYQAMLTMINDEALYERLQSHARTMIASRFEQVLVWEAILEEYRKELTVLELR